MPLGGTQRQFSDSAETAAADVAQPTSFQQVDPHHRSTAPSGSKTDGLRWRRGPSPPCAPRRGHAQPAVTCVDILEAEYVPERRPKGRRPQGSTGACAHRCFSSFPSFDVWSGRIEMRISVAITTHDDQASWTQEGLQKFGDIGPQPLWVTYSRSIHWSARGDYSRLIVAVATLYFEQIRLRGQRSRCLTRTINHGCAEANALKRIPLVRSTQSWYFLRPRVFLDT